MQITKALMLDIEENKLFDDNDVYKVISLNLESMSNEYTLYFDLFKLLLPTCMEVPGDVKKLKNKIRPAFIQCVCTKDVLIIIDGFKNDDS